ncbi:MAG: LysR family transcriptional regulator [Sphingomonadales bacterium]|nr:MAG: LysR family transcriptional regulator [Sphingomonadales bacterium]
MDLRQLRYFMMVADERNFTRAAERLHIAQPPLSRQIQLLEAELGAELLDRRERPLRLTPMGVLFREQAVQILGRVEDMRTMMSQAISTERRRFNVGFVASTIYARLPTLIRQFRAEAPKVDLGLIETVSLDQITALKEGRIDVGFGRIRFEDASVRRTVLREEKLVAAVASGHPLAKETQPISLARLAEEPLIVYPRSPRPSYADQVLSIFRDYGQEPRVAHEARELQIAVGLVAAEEGICIVPESVGMSRVADVRYMDIAEHVTSPIIMSQRVGDHNPELELFASIIVRTYVEWGYAIPEALRQLAAGSRSTG